MHTEKSKILVVDDEPELVDLLKDFLGIKGYKVIGAVSGQEALDILETERVDLVLLDFVMPGLNGTEVAKVAKEKYPYVKFVLMTGFMGMAERLSKVNMLEDVLIKPIEIKELSNRLLEILAKGDKSTLNSNSEHAIKARVLKIKARLLFVEPSAEIYSFLNSYFRALSLAGEDYEMKLADTEEWLYEKLISFKPDIYLVNASLIKEDNKDIASYIAEKNSSNAKIVIYDTDSSNNIRKTELARMAKAVKAICLENGLIDAEWIEI